MITLLEMIPFYLESSNYEGFYIGFKDEFTSVLTRNKSQIKNLKIGDYWTGQKKFDVEGTTEGLSVNANQNISKVPRGKTWTESFSVDQIDNDKGEMIVKYGENSCIAAIGPENEISTRTCTKGEDQKFKVLFTKDIPGYLTSKNDESIALYLPKKPGQGVSMKPLEDSSILMANLEGVDAPMALKEDPTVAFYIDAQQKLLSEKLNFADFDQNTIFRLHSKNGAYQIEVTNSESKKLCAVNLGSGMPINMEACNDQDEKQLFNYLPESDKEAALSRLNSKKKAAMEKKAAEGRKDTTENKKTPQRKQRLFIYSYSRKQSLLSPSKNTSPLKIGGTKEASPFVYDPETKRMHDVKDNELVLDHLIFSHQAVLSPRHGNVSQDMELIKEGESYLIKNSKKCLTRIAGNNVQFGECTGAEETLWKINTPDEKNVISRAIDLINDKINFMGLKEKRRNRSFLVFMPASFYPKRNKKETDKKKLTETQRLKKNVKKVVDKLLNRKKRGTEDDKKEIDKKEIDIKEIDIKEIDKKEIDIKKIDQKEIDKKSNDKIDPIYEPKGRVDDFYGYATSQNIKGKSRIQIRAEELENQFVTGKLKSKIDIVISTPDKKSGLHSPLKIGQPIINGKSTIFCYDPFAQRLRDIRDVNLSLEHNLIDHDAVLGATGASGKQDIIFERQGGSYVIKNGDRCLNRESNNSLKFAPCSGQESSKWFIEKAPSERNPSRELTYDIIKHEDNLREVPEEIGSNPFNGDKIDDLKEKHNQKGPGNKWRFPSFSMPSLGFEMPDWSLPTVPNMSLNFPGLPQGDLNYLKDYLKALGTKFDPLSLGLPEGISPDSFNFLGALMKKFPSVDFGLPEKPDLSAYIGALSRKFPPISLGLPSGFKLPHLPSGLSFPKFNFNMPKFNMPSFNFKLPDGFKLPKLSSNFGINFDKYMKALSLKFPPISLGLPEGIDITCPEYLKALSLKFPEMNFKGPDLDLGEFLNFLKGKFPPIQLGLPSGFEFPSIDLGLKLSNLPLNFSLSNLPKLPSLNLPKFNMPKFGFSMPSFNFKLPDGFKLPKLSSNFGINFDKYMKALSLKFPPISLGLPEGIDITCPEYLKALSLKFPEMKMRGLDLDLGEFLNFLKVRFPPINLGLPSGFEFPSIDLGLKLSVLPTDFSLPNLPKLPSFNMPSFSMPSFSMPSFNMPKFNLPDMPTISPPKFNMPRFSMPSMPNMPSLSMPDMPSFSWPKMGSLPKFSLDFGINFKSYMDKLALKFPAVNLGLPEGISFTSPEYLKALSLQFPDLKINGPDLDLGDFLNFLGKKFPAISLGLPSGFQMPKIDIGLKLGELPSGISLPDLPSFSLPGFKMPSFSGKLGFPNIKFGGGKDYESLIGEYLTALSEKLNPLSLGLPESLKVNCLQYLHALHDKITPRNLGLPDDVEYNSIEYLRAILQRHPPASLKMRGNFEFPNLPDGFKFEKLPYLGTIQNNYKELKDKTVKEGVDLDKVDGMTRFRWVHPPDNNIFTKLLDQLKKVLSPAVLGLPVDIELSSLDFLKALQTKFPPDSVGMTKTGPVDPLVYLKALLLRFVPDSVDSIKELGSKGTVLQRKKEEDDEEPDNEDVEVPNYDFNNIKTRAKILIYSYNRQKGLNSPKKTPGIFYLSPLSNLVAVFYDPRTKLIHDFYNPNLVLDKSYESKAPLLWPKSGSSNQLMELVKAKGGFYIRNEGECLTQMGEDEVLFSTCTGKRNTIWRINVLGEEGEKNERILTK
ncbi:hypothetical protein NUSPORA_01475 [Nucleospora cyclopteri]